MFRVMIVDDDKALRYVYRKMKSWNLYDFQVVAEASNGQQALDMMDKEDIDIVFTDIRMPVMDGIEFMKAAKRLQQSVAFVMISSYHEFNYAREGIREGALDYIVKPMGESDLEQVLQRIANVLEPKESEYLSYFKRITDKEVNWKEPLIINLCRYIVQNLEINLTLEMVAEALELNKDYLGKVIKNRTGINFRDFYNGFKMECAKSMVMSGKYKIYEISNQLGYSSVDYFTRIFKKYVHTTPLAYKNAEIEE